MVSDVWADSSWLEMACLFCSRNCRCVRMAGENKSTPRRQLFLFHSFIHKTHPSKKDFRLLLFCCWAYLFPHSSEVFLDMKASILPAWPQAPHGFLCCALPLNNNPWIPNSVSQSKSQRRILRPLPLHIFKKGKTDQKSSKMTGPLFEPNAGTSPFA